MIIDLTLPIYPGMPVYPGDSYVALHPALSHESDGYSVHDIAINTHTGTHIDAPFHFDPDGKHVDETSILNACVGEALVVDVRNRLNRNEVTPISLSNVIDSLTKGSRLLIATGWSKHFGRDDYYTEFPSISDSLADLLVAKSVALIGLETPSLHVKLDSRIHDKLLSHGIVVVESLANLTKLDKKEVYFSAAPLKLKGLDGSPVRAYAEI